MNHIEKEQLPENPKQLTPGSVLIGRLMWAIFGPCVSLTLLVPLWRNSDWLGIWEWIYFGTIGTMILGRYLEQNSGQGTTLQDEPSTWQHFRVYVVGLLFSSLLGWVAIKLIH